MLRKEAYPFAELWPSFTLDGEAFEPDNWRWTWNVGFKPLDPESDARDSPDVVNGLAVDEPHELALSTFHGHSTHSNGFDPIHRITFGEFAEGALALLVIDELAATLSYAGTQSAIAVHFGPNFEDPDGRVMGDGIGVCGKLARHHAAERYNVPFVLDPWTLSKLPKDSNKCRTLLGVLDVYGDGSVTASVFGWG